MKSNRTILRRKQRQAGSALVEFPLFLWTWTFMFLGSVGIGVTMGRYIQVQTMARDMAHMYSDGVDFSQATPQSIASDLASGMSLTSTGDVVVILSQIQTPYAVDCTASGISPCTNQGIPVFSQRIYMGNTSLRNSTYGTPTSTLMNSSGNISPAVFLSNSDPSVRTSGFEAALDAAYAAAGDPNSSSPVMQQGQVAYVAEVYAKYPDLAFLTTMFGGGGIYANFIFQ